MRKRKYTAIMFVMLLTIILIWSFRALLGIGFGLSSDEISVIAGIGEVVVELVAAIMIVFQLQQEQETEIKQNHIEEAQFILQYNQAFIQDENMSMVEERLERSMLGVLNEPMITDENRQKFINYLVYLEGLAPLILRDVLHLETIDDLMAYRFFIAMNNKELQEDQLLSYAEYYRGCFKLYRKWSQYRKDKGYEILMEENGLDKWSEFEKYAI